MEDKDLLKQTASMPISEKFQENSGVIKDGNENLCLYTIIKRFDVSFSFNDNSGNSIYNLILANSSFHSQLNLYDGSHSWLLTLREKFISLRYTWEAIGPRGKLFKVINSHLQSNSDLIVKGNNENGGFDYKIRENKTDKSFIVYKGSSEQEVSKVVADASDTNKYLVEIDSKEDCNMLKIIVFLVTAIVDARGRTGKKKANSFKFGGGVEVYSYFAKHVSSTVIKRT